MRLSAIFKINASGRRSFSRVNWYLNLEHVRNLPLQWRHNEHHGVTNHQPHYCLLSRLCGGRSKKTSKLRVPGLCEGIHRWPVNSPHTGPVTRKCFHLMTSSWPQWMHCNHNLVRDHAEKLESGNEVDCIMGPSVIVLSIHWFYSQNNTLLSMWYRFNSVYANLLWKKILAIHSISNNPWTLIYRRFVEIGSQWYHVTMTS